MVMLFMVLTTTIMNYGLAMNTISATVDSFLKWITHMRTWQLRRILTWLDVGVPGLNKALRNVAQLKHVKTKLLVLIH